MKKILGIAITVLLIATFINDVGRYATTRYNLSTIANEAARVGSQRHKTRDENAVAAAAYARTQGATVYLFDQDTNQVRVWAEMPVTGTWFLGPFEAYQAGQPLSTAFKIQLQSKAILD